MRQTHPDRQLLVVFDGPGSIRDLIPDSPAIRLVELSGERTLGRKFNACVELAETDLVALWADDDWHAPHRLEKTIAHLGDVKIVGTHQMLFHDLLKSETWIYKWTRRQHYLLGGTLAFHRSVWESAPFPNVESAVDNGFCYNALIKGATPYTVIPGCEMYVAMVHHNNVRGEFVPNWPYEPWPDDVKDVMGDDYERYVSCYRSGVSRM